MKKFENYIKEQGTYGNNPNNDVNQYIQGTKNRLILLRPEEIEPIRIKLEELKSVIEQVLYKK